MIRRKNSKNTEKKTQEDTKKNQNNSNKTTKNVKFPLIFFKDSQETQKNTKKTQRAPKTPRKQKMSSLLEVSSRIFEETSSKLRGNLEDSLSPLRADYDILTTAKIFLAENCPKLSLFC